MQVQLAKTRGSKYGARRQSRRRPRKNSHQSTVFGEAGNGTMVGIFALSECNDRVSKKSVISTVSRLPANGQILFVPRNKFQNLPRVPPLGGIGGNIGAPGGVNAPQSAAHIHDSRLHSVPPLSRAAFSSIWRVLPPISRWIRSSHAFRSSFIPRRTQSSTAPTKAD